VAQWTAPDRVVTYQVQDGRLVRWDETGGITTTIANHVTALIVAQDTTYLNQVHITITLSYRNFTATYNFVGVKPS
jgi:hypothetical protein